ncbi:hypothetical protein GCM10009765_83680 [Fodinicola feengrottensis]|uniref:Uncharacterized protein n=2 Tax=Fodinicola feengrottensis TaxID=435914 RepID=A0ABN2JD29_9ACTN
MWLVVTPHSEPSRARIYLAFTACLLTDSRGTAGEAAPVWAGMQKASLTTHAKVQFLAAYGPQTEANAVPYVNTLAQRKCNVILAADKTSVDAVASNAHRFPRTTFVVVGSQAAQSNVVVVNASHDQIPAAVEGVIKKAVAG